MSDYPLTAELVDRLSDDDLDDRLWQQLTRRAPPTDRSAVGALRPRVRAYYATRVFEWEVGNGGLYQYFLNWEGQPWLLALVLEGYDTLGLTAMRRLIEGTIAPVAMSDEERRLRAANRREPFGPQSEISRLNEFDDLIE